MNAPHEVWRDEVERVEEEIAAKARVVMPRPVAIMDCFTNTPPIPDLVLPGLRVASVGSIVSPGGTGKSMLALQFALFVSAGIDHLGILTEISRAADFANADQPARTGKVVYLSAEDGADVLHERLFALGAHLSPQQREAVASNLQLLDMTAQGGDLFESEFRRAVEEEMTDARLLIIDTLRTFHSQDESDNGQMSLLITWLRRMAVVKQCAIIFLHHTSKAATLNGLGDVQQASRGASALTDNIRWQAFLAGLSKDETLDGKVVLPEERGLFVRYGVSKQNYGKKMADVWLRRGEGGVMSRVDGSSTGNFGTPLVPHTPAQAQASSRARTSI